MKKEYVSPAFYAENYEVNDSIATCDIKVGENVSPTPINIQKGDHLCTNQNCSHTAGGHQKALIKEYPTTLFNDGSQSDSCKYDWDGTSVTGGGIKDSASFGAAFLGPEANSDQHRPAYKTQTFFS